MGANLSEADLSQANLILGDLSQANLSRAELSGAILNRADLSGADLRKARLNGSDLSQANLIGSDLSQASLMNSNLLRAKINNVKISNSNVYGVNVWDLEGDFKEQKDLIITPLNESSITVDNIKVAQFVFTTGQDEKYQEASPQMRQGSAGQNLTDVPRGASRAERDSSHIGQRDG